MSGLRHLPNAITLLRALMIPVIALALVLRDYESALLLFVLCAVGDFADGWLARAFDLRTRFGAIADPLADKLTMLTLATLLTWQGHLPLWFALLVVARDLLIVGGAIAYHLHVGHVTMAPTRLSKLNTALEFAVLTVVLMLAAGLVEAAFWQRVLLWTCTATLIASGMQYVVLWSHKAAQARQRADRGDGAGAPRGA